MNILFIGNSFTFRHNIPELVKTVFEEGRPDLTVNTKKIIYGGQNMFLHSTYYFSQTFIEQSTITDEEINERIERMQGFLELDSAPDEFKHFWEVIDPSVNADEMFTGKTRNIIGTAIENHKELLENNPKTNWDYIVLQSWKDMHPSLDEGYAKMAIELAELAKEQGAEVILYITAPDIQNGYPITEAPRQEQVGQEIKLAQELAKKIGAAAVVPVPLAINMIQQGGTEMLFRYINDFHPNQVTAFLTANLFYTALFKESTVGFRFNTVTETKLQSEGEAIGMDPDGGQPTVVFAEETQIYLQKIAFDAAMAFKAEAATN